MKIDLSTVGTLFRTEMRMVLRDRRTIITSIVLPLLVMPLMLFGSSWASKKREQKLEKTVCRYVVTGSQAAAVRAVVAATRRRLEADEKAGKKEGLRLDEVTVADASTSLTNGDVHLVLEGLTADEVKPTLQEVQPEKKGKDRNRRIMAKAESQEDDAAPRMAGAAKAPVVRFYFRADRDDSVAGMHRLRDALQDTRRAQRIELLRARGFPLPTEQIAAVIEINVASKGQVAGLALGRIITLFLLLFILMGGAVVATDLVAGEKERGTLETLLTTGARRVEIVAAKHLVILAVALVITLIQAVNLLVYVGCKLIPVSVNFAAAVPPSVAAMLLVLYLPMAALAASVLLVTSGYAKSYKEAQLYFLPLILLVLAPALSPLLPGLPLRSAIVFVPVANIALAAKEILIGSFDWPMIALSWLVTGAAAAWIARVGVRFLSAEKLITAADMDAIEFSGGPALFGRQVWRWFAVLWALLLIVNNYTATADIRLQLLINLVALFFGASLIMIRHYRLDPRAALAWRAPKPVVWLAVLIAVPSGQLTGIGLFHLANLFIPVPPKMLEGFGESVVPEDIPFGQLLFFLTVLPGIIEEITFRGVLLHGLHRRLRPAALAVVVGLVFGLFHVALFRLVPTAFLGILLAAVVLLTGSIFPAMLWHALNNAIGILALKQQIPLAELDPLCYVAGAVGLAAAFWIIGRNRTPYLGLLPRRRSNQT